MKEVMEISLKENNFQIEVEDHKTLLNLILIALKVKSYLLKTWIIIVKKNKPSKSQVQIDKKNQKLRQDLFMNQENLFKVEEDGLRG